MEFDRFKIDELLKSKNIKYINYNSSPILAVIVEKKNNVIKLWSTNDFEKNWNKKSNNLLNAFPPNGDLTDINFLMEIDANSYQISRIDRLTENYGVRDFIFIVFDHDLNKEKDNIFLKYQFNELKFSKKFQLKDFDENSIQNLFDKLIYELNNSWKEIQILSPLKNNIIKLWSINDFEKNWNKKSNNLLNAFPPNGDLTDLNFLKEIDVNSYQISRIDRLTANYGVRDFVFIVFDHDLNKEKDNIFVKYQFSELKFSKKFQLKDFDENSIQNLFNKLILELNNAWKEIQILSPSKNNSFVFDYNLKNLSEYIEIKKTLKSSNNIISLNDVEITNKNYSGNIVFSGSRESFLESLVKFNLFFENKNGKIFLKKND